MILAGDIGGTKCTLKLFARHGTALRPLYRFTTPTRENPDLETLLENFRASASQQGHVLKGGTLSSAAFGVAGAIVEDRIVTNNLPWAVDRRSIAKSLGLGLDRVLLLNDLVSAASSLAYLDQHDLLPLNEGSPQPRAPKALIAAGTGLGEAILFWNGHGYQVFPSEASLTDFAPRNDRELLLLQSLRQRMPRVCTEEIVSGRGLCAVHQILFPGVYHHFFDQPGEDAAARITHEAFAGSCAACVDTLQVWTEAYGAEAGNMALRVLPFGGVYIAGGIALKILPKLKEGSFVRAFSDKLKLSTQLAKIPIYVVLNEDAPVLGAAHEALAVCIT
jgi:glucokinase